MKKLVWDLNEFALRHEYKIAIEHHGILEELAIIADGPGKFFFLRLHSPGAYTQKIPLSSSIPCTGTSVNFEYSRSSLPTCRKLSLSCYQGPTSISWNYVGNEGTDQLLDTQPQMFLYGSHYFLGMDVVIYNGQYSNASERACSYQQTGRDRQDLAFQFHWLIRVAESLWMRNSWFAFKQCLPPLSFIPCMPDPLLVQKSIPIWLFVFGAARDKWLNLALACVMGGVLGNLYDRLGLSGEDWAGAGHIPAQRKRKGPQRR